MMVLDEIVLEIGNGCDFFVYLVINAVDEKAVA
jgi:hypothetical protein